MAIRDEQFDAMLDAELRSLDAELAVAMAAPHASAEMVERIDAACGLAEALRVESPEGLADRIHHATAGALRGGSVLARIGPAARWAIAAGVVLAAVVALRWGQPGGSSVDLLALDRHIDQAAADADFAGPAVTDIDATTVALALEIDELASAMEGDDLSDLFDNGIEQLSDEMTDLEDETDVF